eukprot:TRINITY_DN219_c0_g1_i2.p1 TRINITY_DN219_c0_g1~~TRINITY_DN219_c0_g1_i2.p1  ORF type:complete len:331 (+),score=144.11 TRINITY_DN219_c0_g1_i2:125-994(+)
MGTGAAYSLLAGTEQAHAFWNPFAKVPYGAELRNDVVALLESSEPPLGPEFVRLAWHSSGTYTKGEQGGNHGTMDKVPEKDDPANAGLGKARGALAPLVAKHSISKADLWVLASLIAIDEMGGPKIPFHYGRQDGNKCPPTGRLPDAAQGSDHIRSVFYRMGFNDQEIVALIGAHALGRCNKDRSGYEGPWTNDPYGFSNSFFTELTEKTWQIKPSSRGTPNEQFEDAETKKLMMLPADMALLSDPKFRVYVDKYAADNDKFFDDFSAAYTKLMNLGWEGQLSGPTTDY